MRNEYDDADDARQALDRAYKAKRAPLDAKCRDLANRISAAESAARIEAIRQQVFAEAA